MSTPPIGSPNRVPSNEVQPPQVLPQEEGSPVIENMAERLPSPPVAPPQSLTSKLWSWFPWGKQPEQSVPQQRMESSAEREEDEERSLDLEQGELASQTQEYESQVAVEQEELSININKVEEEIPVERKKAEFAGTVAKTQSWWQRLGGNVVGGIKSGASYVASGGAQLLTKGIQTYAQSYSSSIDRENAIVLAKHEMLDHLNDSQYIELFDFARVLLVRVANNKIDETFHDEGFVARNILPQRGLILNLLEINLAKGFANLAKQVHQNEGKIPNFGKQPSLVSILSLFSQKAGAHIDAQTLAKIEEKYRNDRAKLASLTQKLFPNIEKEPKTQALIKKFIQEGDLTHEIANQLFPDFEDVEGERANDIRDFEATLRALNYRHKEMHDLFSKVADDVLVYLFPNKFADLELPAFLQGGFGETIYDYFVKDLIVDFLQESYEPLENDPIRIEGWKKDLETKVGAPDLQPVIEAPSALSAAFVKNYIQADPRVVGLIAWALDSIIHPEEASSEVLSEVQKQKQLFAQLSQEQLANWFVESGQEMLHTQDPNLLGLGQFAKQMLNNAVLAIEAKGAKLVIPEGKKVEGHDFVKECSEGLVALFQSLQTDAIPDQFWKDFVQDLPLPPFVKELLVPKLIEKAKSLQENLKQQSPEWQQIQTIYSETEEKIQKYAYGKELLTITEKVSDQIIEQALVRNFGLVDTLGLGDTVEELFAEYLPGVKINEDLKAWFKDNISALGVTENGQSPQSIVLLKHGVQAVLRKGLVELIETNFKSDGKDYAAQLLKNIHQAFAKSIAGFDQSQREELDIALAVQGDIKTKAEKIEALKKVMVNKPQGIKPEQSSLIEETLHANIRYLRASGYFNSLIQKRDEILKKLNAEFKDAPWTVEELPTVSQALVLHKIQSTLYPDFKKHVEELRNQTRKLQEKQAIIEQGVDQDQKDQAELIKKQLSEREMLLVLLEMSSEELQLVSDAINTQVTIQHAQKEVEYLKANLKEKEHGVERHDPEGLGNTPEWSNAKQWLGETLKNRQEVEQLSRQIKQLEKELDSHLTIFQSLSQELSALIGLDQKEKLNLPSFVQDTVWPLIESAQKEHIARILFEQINPILLPALDIKENKQKLNDFSNNNQFLANLAQGVSQEFVSRISEFVTSYKPFAKLNLTIMGIDAPTAQEIASMEKSLKQKMIEIGREGTAASMLEPVLKGLVPEEKEKALSQSFEQLVQVAGKELSEDQLLPILEKEFPPANAKEKQELAKKAEILAKSMNQFLLNRGKGKLKPQDLIDAYQSQISGVQKPISPDQVEGVLHDLQSDSVVEKIKTVIITPEEIATALNDLIPGATELHTLIGRQIQDVIVGDDPTFKENRELIQRYVEGMLLRVFVKIAESNSIKNEDVLTVLTRKLKDLTINAKAIQGKKSEEVAHQMIDQILENIIGIESQIDLEGVPPVLRKVGYDKLKEQAYQQLTPLMLPIIEQAQNRAELDKISGSKFLSSLCTAISKDAFFLLPAGIKSYHAIASKFFVLLSDGKQPTADEVDQFTQEIATLVEKSVDKNITHHALVQAYGRVAKIQLTPAQQEVLKDKLEKVHAKEEIKNVLITPEEISELIGAQFPHINSKLQLAFANEIQGLLHNNPEVYQNISDFAGTYVEGMLLRAFIRIAEKHPAQNGNDTLILLTEHLLEVVATKYPDIKNRPFDEFAQESIDLIMKDILGIDSPDDLEGLPEPLKATAYKAIKDQLVTRLKDMQESLAIFEKEAQKAAENAKQFGIDEDAVEGYAQILANDVANLVINFVPDFLTEIGGDKMKGVNLITQSVESYLEELARGNLQVAKLLLTYTKGARFQKLLGDTLAKLADAKNLVEDKKIAAELLSQMILVPLNQALKTAVDFEDQHGAKFNQKLITDLLTVLGEHLERTNAVKEGRLPPVQPIVVDYQHSIDEITKGIYEGRMSQQQQAVWTQKQADLRTAFARLAQEESQGVRVISHKDIIAEMEKIQKEVKGRGLSKGERQKLKAKNEQGLGLRDLIRQETQAPKLKQQEEFFTPATKALMKMIFPNGKKDLTYVPEEFRGQVWKIYKKNLFPVVLPMMFDLVLDPSVVNSMVLSSLETMRDSLLPLGEMPPAKLLSMLKGGQLLIKTTEQNAKEVLDKKISGEALLKMAKEGKLIVKPDLSEPEDLTLGALDEAAGKLVAEALKTVKLPNWIKKQFVDPKTGKTSPMIEQTLGSTLRKQFNDTFIKDKLQIALETVVRRDENGNYLLNVPPLPKTDEEKIAKAEKETEQKVKMEGDIKRATREVVDVSIAYTIRTLWESAQSRFDKFIERTFGRIGTQLKRALDMVFGFIFFKIVGTILSFIFSPIKGWIKERIYNLINLDQNRDTLLALWTPELLFNLSKTLKRTFEEALHEPILPQRIIPEV